MPHLLHLDSSADGEHSRSRAITRTFADTWRGGGPQYTVTYRDLHHDPLPHLTDAALHWPPRLRPAGATPPAAAEALQQELITELTAADVLLVGAPMYNYSLPSSLKAWVDHIHVPGVTAPFDVASQPLAGRPAVVVTSRGAAYDEGTPTAGWDHAVPVLTIILGARLGMAVTVIATSLTLAETVPPLAGQIERSRTELAQAHQAAAETARRLAGLNHRGRVRSLRDVHDRIGLSRKTSAGGSPMTSQHIAVVPVPGARVAPEADARATAALPGTPFPLGATPGERLGKTGTNFAIASSMASGVTLCLFDGAGRETQIALPDNDADIWHVFVPGVGPGQAYGYRVSGPWNPAQGQRCNPAKLLLDPYARAVSGTVSFGPELLGHDQNDPDAPSTLDSSAHVPRSLVVDAAFDWRDAGRPWHRYADTVLYEVHVKGFTMRHPGVPEELRGTYAGLGHEAAIAHLLDLGVTTIELLPVHHNVPESFLVGRGLTNYWGYNTIGFFAPHSGYSAEVRAGRPGGQVGEFKAMVDALHRAGLEVVLDVVFNHTAEAGPDGPTLCFRGIDNSAYYRLVPGNPSEYYDTTGCGNSLNAGDPITLQLFMDSLRYWISEMHVDGFRFDLAPTLARQDGAFDKVAAFLDMVAQDPLVSRTKLVAEPWDVGQGDSYDLGRFPALWREWNGKYRDTMRDYWRGREVGIGEVADRFSGSADLYATAGRRPTSSVNLITVHDGFSLADLVSYDNKHNEANGEDNRDGTDDNRSWNCGAEGPTTDPEILALRARQSRAMLTTLMLSFGVPLLLGGDEMGRTQRGNNNAYCQDNELTWFDWANADKDLLDFTSRLIKFRRSHPVFRRRRFLSGTEAAELQWFTPAGTAMDPGDWADPGARAIAIYLDGTDDPDRGEDGSPLLDDDFLVLINAWWEPLSFVLPATRPGARWHAEIDTYDPAGAAGAPQRQAGDQVTVSPRSIMVLQAAASS